MAVPVDVLPGHRLKNIWPAASAHLHFSFRLYAIGVFKMPARISSMASFWLDTKKFGGDAFWFKAFEVGANIQDIQTLHQIKPNPWSKSDTYQHFLDRNKKWNCLHIWLLETTVSISVISTIVYSRRIRHVLLDVWQIFRRFEKSFRIHSKIENWWSQVSHSHSLIVHNLQEYSTFPFDIPTAFMYWCLLRWVSIGTYSFSINFDITIIHYNKSLT